MSIPNDANTYLPGTIQIPSSIEIIALTNSYPMIATIDVNPLTESNTYQEGQLVKLNIPITYGMFQANGLIPKVLLVNGNNLYLDVDSTQFDKFSIPAPGSLQPATLAPSGSRNLELNNDTAFVPFQSLNNIGN